MMNGLQYQYLNESEVSSPEPLHGCNIGPPSSLSILVMSYQNIVVKALNILSSIQREYEKHSLDDIFAK